MKRQNVKNLRRQQRIRKHIRSVSDRPRLTVFRSNVHLYAQIIDDVKQVTLVAVSEKEAGAAGTKIEKAAALGKTLAEKAKALKVTEVVFDKGSYKYHGRVKAFAEEARKEGLNF